MTNYSDIEIETAKNMLKKGLKWIARNQSGRLFAHACKPSKVGTYWWSVGYSDCTCAYVPIFKNIRFEDKEPTSIESIVHPQILDDAEKKYLSAVIRPFRYRAVFVKKIYHVGNYEQIIVRVKSIATDTDIADIPFPFFNEGQMYKGMKLNKEYTLEELGL